MPTQLYGTSISDYQNHGSLQNARDQGYELLQNHTPWSICTGPMQAHVKDGAAMFLLQNAGPRSWWQDRSLPTTDDNLLQNACFPCSRSTNMF